MNWFVADENRILARFEQGVEPLEQGSATYVEGTSSSNIQLLWIAYADGLIGLVFSNSGLDKKNVDVGISLFWGYLLPKTIAGV